jgi:hypothetical protein
VRESNNSAWIGQALSAVDDCRATGRRTNNPSLILRKTPVCALLQPMPVDAPH